MVNELSTDGELILSWESFNKMTADQKTLVFGAMSKINGVITELNDPDKVLHIYNVPPELVPAINKYNKTQHGPNSKPINITDICVKVLQNALEQVTAVWESPADEMEDDDE